MAKWNCVLELDEKRQVTSGSAAALCAAVRGGADLRAGTVFHHNEHIDTSSRNNEAVCEVMDFRVVYLVEDRWVAGIQNMRMPVNLWEGFGPRASMSFFLYNQDGHQAVARPYLDGQAASGQLGPVPVDEHSEMPKYHELESWDVDTNAPSSNFIYDFDNFRYFVCEQWEQVFAHDADGNVTDGSVEALGVAAAQGREVKVAIAGLCDDLAGDEVALGHEVFVHGGATYYYTEAQNFMVAAHPLIRTRAAVPLGYASRAWDFGWVKPCSDGRVFRWLVDPYTLTYHRSEGRYAMRWFVSE